MIFGYIINKSNDGEWHEISGKVIIILKDDNGELISAKIETVYSKLCTEKEVGAKTSEVIGDLLKKVNATLGTKAELVNDDEAENA